MRNTIETGNEMIGKSIKITACLSLPFIFLLLCGSLFSQQDTLVTLYSEAQAAQASGNYALAVQKYEQIITLRPDMAEAYANIGNLYYVQGDSAKAEASFKKALQRKPGLAAPHLMLGILAFNGQNFDQAVRYLNSALRIEPASVMANQYLGYTKYALAHYAESVELLEKVLAEDSKNLDAWYHLTKAYGQLSKNYFEQLQKRFPDSVETYMARSHFYESAGNWAEAREQLLKVQTKQPGNEQIVRQLDWLQRRATSETPIPPPDDSGSMRYMYSPPTGADVQTAFSSEAAAIQKLLKTTPQSVKSLYGLAEGYQAVSFLASLWLVQIDPDSFRAHQVRAQSLEAVGHLDDAVKEYREVLARKPDLQTVHFAIGNLYWRNGRLDEALPELEAELKLNPRDAQAHYEIADILLVRNNEDLAEKHFDEAVKLSASMTEAHLALEKIAAAKGNFTKALGHLKSVSRLEPGNPTPHYRMWLLYRRLNKPTEAQAERSIFEKLKGQGSASAAN